MDIKDLHRQGLSQRQIAARTGRSRKTVRKLLAQQTPQPFQRPPRKSRLDPFKPYLTSRYQQYGLSGVRLLAEIEAQGFTGSLDIVQRFLKTLKHEQAAKAKATVRFETAPGQQAQADWAEVVRFEGRKIYAFVMVLSFSRMLYVEFTTSMDLPSLIACHQRAFVYFGGLPGSVLYDNMAQVRLPGSHALNPLMADFAAHHGFAVKTHQPYRPRTKGKVERMVDYLKDNFLRGAPLLAWRTCLLRGATGSSTWPTAASTPRPESVLSTCCPRRISPNCAWCARMYWRNATSARWTRRASSAWLERAIPSRPSMWASALSWCSTRRLSKLRPVI